MRKLILYYCSLGCFALATPAMFGTSARAASVPDQGQIFNTDGRVFLGTDFWSQSITTGLGTGLEGQLTGIQILIENPRDDMNFEFSVIDGGNPPTGSVLFSQQLTLFPTDLDGTLYTWDVSAANLFFEVGDVFTFAFQGDSDLELSGNDPPGYDGGELFKNGAPSGDEPGEVRDAAFITYVDPMAVQAQPSIQEIEVEFEGPCTSGDCTYGSDIEGKCGIELPGADIERTVINDTVLELNTMGQVVLTCEDEESDFEAKARVNSMFQNIATGEISCCTDDNADGVCNGDDGYYLVTNPYTLGRSTCVAGWSKLVTDKPEKVASSQEGKSLD